MSPASLRNNLQRSYPPCPLISMPLKSADSRPNLMPRTIVRSMAIGTLSTKRLYATVIHIASIMHDQAKKGGTLRTLEITSDLGHYFDGRFHRVRWEQPRQGRRVDIGKAQRSKGRSRPAH